MVLDSTNSKIYAAMTVKGNSGGTLVKSVIMKTDMTYTTITTAVLNFGSSVNRTSYLMSPDVLTWISGNRVMGFGIQTTYNSRTHTANYQYLMVWIELTAAANDVYESYRVDFLRNRNLNLLSAYRYSST